MQQKLVYLHTDKNLKETEEILKQQGMEIILTTDSLQLNFSDMTEAEQLSYLETLDVVSEDTANQLDIQHKGIGSLAMLYNSFSKEFRVVLHSLKNSENTDRIKNFQHLQEEFKKIQQLAFTVNCLVEKSRTMHLDGSIECSCLIAKMGTDVIRYLEFEDDPILTITGPNATNLKISLESKF